MFIYHQKIKNEPQALLNLIKKMHEAVSEGNYGAAIKVDNEDFDTAKRKRAWYEPQHMAGKNSKSSVSFPCFVEDDAKNNL